MILQYDIESEVVPGVATDLVFMARVTGRFPVNFHAADAPPSQGHDEPPLVRIEVHPL